MAIRLDKNIQKVEDSPAVQHPVLDLTKEERLCLFLDSWNVENSPLSSAWMVNVDISSATQEAVKVVQRQTHLLSDRFQKLLGVQRESLFVIVLNALPLPVRRKVFVGISEPISALYPDFFTLQSSFQLAQHAHLKIVLVCPRSIAQYKLLPMTSENIFGNVFSLWIVGVLGIQVPVDQFKTLQ